LINWSKNGSGAKIFEAVRDYRTFMPRDINNTENKLSGVAVNSGLQHEILAAGHNHVDSKELISDLQMI